MEIILLQDVKTLGKKGQVINVNDGYARNFVIPKKLGIEATSKNINDLKLQKSNEEKIAKEILEAAKALALKIEEKPIALTIKAGESGKTFGSIATKEIGKAVLDQLGLDIDKKKIVLPDPIKTMGTHEVSIKLHKDVTAKLTIKITES